MDLFKNTWFLAVYMRVKKLGINSPFAVQLGIRTLTRPTQANIRTHPSLSIQGKTTSIKTERKNAINKRKCTHVRKKCCAQAESKKKRKKEREKKK
jgi:hypothetical protein